MKAAKSSLFYTVQNRREKLAQSQLFSWQVDKTSQLSCQQRHPAKTCRSALSPVAYALVDTPLSSYHIFILLSFHPTSVPVYPPPPSKKNLQETIISLIFVKCRTSVLYITTLWVL